MDIPHGRILLGIDMMSPSVLPQVLAPLLIIADPPERTWPLVQRILRQFVLHQDAGCR